jgi:predicted HicB family RNase H-like nuclease
MLLLFQGTTVDEIEHAFKDSIDDYIEWRLAEGVQPEKPYSGNFNVLCLPYPLFAFCAVLSV